MTGIIFEYCNSSHSRRRAVDIYMLLHLQRLAIETRENIHYAYLSVFCNRNVQFVIIIDQLGSRSKHLSFPQALYFF